MSTFFKYIILALLACLLGAIAYLWVADFSELKPFIEKKVSEATGREFHIDGEFSLSVLPTPTLMVENVRLAGPEWSEKSQMLEVDSLYAQVGLWSLLFQPIEVNDFSLSGVNVVVETNADGQLNWQMGEAQPEPDEPEAERGEFPLNVHRASLNDIRVSYLAEGELKQEFVLSSLDVDEQEDHNTVLLAAMLGDISLSAEGNANREMAAFTALAGDAEISSELQYPDKSVAFSLNVQSLARVGELVELSGLPDETLVLKGELELDGSLVTLKQWVVSLADVEVLLDGQLNGEDSTVALSTRITADSLGLIAPELPKVRFSAQSEIAMGPDTLELKPFSLSLEDSKLNGFAVIRSGDTPTIQVEASSELFDLSPLAPESQQGEVSQQSELPKGAEQSEEEADSETQNSEWVFDEKPLPFEMLRKLDMDIKIDIARLVTPNAQLNNVAFSSRLDNGVLDFKTDFEGQYSGQYHTQLGLNAQSDNAQFTLDTSVTDFKLAALSGADVPEDQIPLTALDMSLTSNGSSPRQLASGLNGRVALTQGAGKVSNKLIGKLSGDILAQLFSALNPFAEEEEFTNWECSVFALDFEAGVGEISGFLFQSEKLMVVGGGELDLNDESIDIEFNTKPRKGVGVSADMFVTPFVKLSGSLSEPSVGLNQKGVLLSGGAAILTGGLSFLYTGLMDRATAEGGRCEEAMQGLHTPPGQEQIQSNE
ncbi:AsmA family protein [Alteromonas aestuariivivens]|uniref:AsmA family protein n=1 Tax=Alteromonas aestuariivivens TaxID=1938339 RepID=A0A3D8ME40_9ALTE|nr:AsmA family protein [Alteromonas aestuariivivens]RDV28137.1 AsmA family protein [Alteromonas aestuariivivens]